jgi:hypothetical protein
MLNQFKETHGNGARDSGSAPCLYYDYFLIDAVKGNEIMGHVEAAKGSPIIFYILSRDQLNQFNHSYCGQDVWGWELYAFSDSYDLDFAVPQTGEYALLFVCPKWYCYDPISIYARVYSTTVQSSSVTYSSTRTYTVQSSQIILLTQSSIAQQPTLNKLNYALVAAVMIAVFALCIGFIMYRVKRRT